ncbi:peptide deformylase [Bacillus massiliigorillae]|uniref:peptide deformylase n=1 Tax=Bacillus massiliigorillae TaxID=1243664 RepID=UPI0003A46557|nr:peptide deformylase [Bacillus massiliigorillae]
MAILKIITHPNAILEKKCEDVTVFDDKLEKLLDDMYDTMVKADGVGLAAPQVGVAKRIAIVEIDPEEGTLEMINPEIIERKGSEVDVEGCLSFPGVYGEVERAYTVTIRAQQRDGQEYILQAEDFHARAIQHEIDHLDGILFTSKVTRYIDEEEFEGYEEE